MTVRFRVVFALACAVLAALLCGVYAQHVQDEADRARRESLERYGGDVVKLVVAERDLHAGETVASGQIAVKEWLSDLAPRGALREEDEALGRRLTSAVPAGMPLCGIDFSSADEAPVPEGHVALSIALGERLGLPAQAETGSRLLAFRVAEGTAKLVSGDVTLLSAGGEGGRSPGTATLAVLPSEAADLLAASASGSLRLAVPASDVVASGTVLETAPTSVPSAAPEGSTR